MKPILIFIFCLLSAVGAVASSFGVKDGQFVLDGAAFQVRSGEIHYSRVPAEEWRNRIRMAKGMGLNTISTYVFWNYHETTKGTYDFTGEKDIAQFVRICGEEGMKAIVRPGPYVCAEWDLGGIPAWILAEDGVKLRSTDARYLAPAKEWMRRMGAMLEPLSVAKGGPVIMVQLENEFGSFGKNKEYLQTLEGAIRGGGYSGLLFTGDGSGVGNLTNGSLPGMLKAVNFGSNAAGAFQALEATAPGQPKFTAEFWVGWFDQWERPHHQAGVRKKAVDLAWMMREGASFNLYMFHGGSTRGMLSGANWDGRYRPTTCCYDYDAPLDESGRPTAKYHDFRSIIEKYANDGKVQDVPAVIPPSNIGTIKFTEYAELTSALSSGKSPESVKTMEYYGQSAGFIAYQTSLQGPLQAPLDLAAVKDRVHVMVDGKLVGIGGRSTAATPVQLNLSEGKHQVILVVENVGRVNYGNMDGERKGLEKPLVVGEKEIGKFVTTLLPAHEVPKVKFTSFEKPPERKGIGLYRAKFKTPSRTDTWLDLSSFGRGVVWLNGRNMGRYWVKGPAFTVFVPGVWLESDKENELVVMELENSACPFEVPTIGQISWEKGSRRPPFQTINRQAR
jgi:beta-galactosidase